MDTEIDTPALLCALFTAWVAASPIPFKILVGCAFCKLSIRNCQEMIIHRVDKGEPLKMKGDLTVLWKYGSLQDFEWLGAEQGLEAGRDGPEVLGLWKLRPESKWKGQKGPGFFPKTSVDEKGSWIQETTHPMGGALVVSLDPLLDPSTMLGSAGWSRLSFFGILSTMPGNVNVRNI